MCGWIRRANKFIAEPPPPPPEPFDFSPPAGQYEHPFHNLLEAINPPSWFYYGDRGFMLYDDGNFIVTLDDYGGVTSAQQPYGPYAKPIYAPYHGQRDQRWRGVMRGNGCYVAYGGESYRNGNAGAMIGYTSSPSGAYNIRCWPDQPNYKDFDWVTAGLYHNGHYIFMASSGDHFTVAHCTNIAAIVDNPQSVMSMVWHVPPVELSNFGGLAHNGDHYVACVNGRSTPGYIVYATDFAGNWTYVPLESDDIHSNLFGVFCVNGYTIVTWMDPGTRQACYMYTTNAAGTWAKVAIPNCTRMSDIIYRDGIYIAIGGVGGAYSSDVRIYQTTDITSANSWTETQINYQVSWDYTNEGKIVVIDNTLYIFLVSQGYFELDLTR